LSGFLRYWLLLGLRCLGCGAPREESLRNELVDVRGWFTGMAYARGLAFCRLLPGATTHQVAVYLGWRLYGWRGGALAGAAVLAPAVAAMLGLCLLAAGFGGDVLPAPLAAGTLRAVAGLALALLVRAFWRTCRAALTHPVFYGFAAASFLMGYGLHLKFYGIIVAAVLLSLWLFQAKPELFRPGGAQPDDAAGKAAGDDTGAGMDDGAPPRPKGSPWRHAGRVFAGCAGVWLLAGLPVLLFTEPGSVLPRVLNFYTRAGFFAFGGAYGVLSFVSDMSLRLGWMAQGTLAQGLGLSGLAPGPVFGVAQWAGFMTAFAHPGGLTPLVAGALGGLAAAFGLQLPGVFLVLAGAPYGAALVASPRLRAVLMGIGAAMAGVILKLGLLLGQAVLWPQGLTPGFCGGLDLVPLAVAAACGLALWRGWAGLPLLALLCAVFGAVVSLPA